MNTFLSSISNAIETQQLLTKQKRVLVALSGGADSVALLLALISLGYDVAAAHCNFHLRGEESDRDEAFVRQLCEERGVKLFVAHFDTTAEAADKGESIEMAARRLRYAWFDELCKAEGFQAVCTAHHRDDNVETMLLNLVRGTGIRGLTGMALRREGVVRPMLRLSREDILVFLAREGQAYVTDSTNADTQFKRNFIRHRILPMLRELNPRIDRTLSETMRRLSEAEEAYDAQFRKALASHGELHSWGEAFPVAQLWQPGQWEAIGRRFGFSQADIWAMQRAEQSERAIYESRDFVAGVYRERLEIARRPDPIEITLTLPTDVGERHHIPVDHGAISALEVGIFKAGALPLPTQSTASLTESSTQSRFMLRFPLSEIKGNVVLRSPATADRIVLPRRGTKLLADFLAERHLSKIVRPWQHVVTDDNGILWVVGQERSARTLSVKPGERYLLITAIPKARSAFSSESL